MNKDLPVILCSAYGEFKQDFSSWASDGYVVKSADTKELKQTIKDILGIE
jgi:two-component SAPR family response regulator